VSAPHYWTQRRQAAQRLPLLDCGRHADPWPCRCSEPPLVEKNLDGWCDTIAHLSRLGTPAVVPAEALAGLRRRGGADAAVAELAAAVAA